MRPQTDSSAEQRRQEPARWLVEDHDDGVHHVTRYVQVFESPLRRVQGFITRTRFLLASLHLLYNFNKTLFYQAPFCFGVIALAKAATALQGAAKVYTTGVLMRQTQQYLQGKREEYEMLPVMAALLVIGVMPGVIRTWTLWPRGRIALLVNISVDERLMLGFSRLKEEDRQQEHVKDLVNEASRLYISEHGGGGPMRGLLGAEEVFGVVTKAFGVPLRLWAILRLVESARSLVIVLALFSLFEDRLFLSSAKRLWSRASNSISLTSKLHVQLDRLSQIMTQPQYESDVQMLGLAPWLLKEHATTAAQIRQSEAALVGMRRFDIRHEGQRELHIVLRHIFVAAILLGFTARARRAGQETLSVASWALVQQAAQDLSREVGSVQRDHHRLYDHCRQLVALDKFEKIKSDEGVDVGAASGKKVVDKADTKMAIELRNVSFSYPGREESVLDDVSFGVEEGEMVALVGLNGSGKSTIAKLLSGSYRVQAGQGAVLVKGNNVQDLSPEQLSNLVSTLPQKPTLLPLTIRDNIGLGYQDDETIEAAARQTGADHFILGHPSGYSGLLAPPHIKSGRQQADTFRLVQAGDHVQIVSHGVSTIRSETMSNISAEEARRLTDQVTHRWEPPRMPSGGEAQRIALARALVKEASILILDEPTNNVDVQGTQQILQTIQQLRGSRTLIVIAHHWPGITDVADKVVLMEKGRVVQTGTHAELLEEGGSYANLWALQMAGQRLEPNERPAHASARGGRGRRGARREPKR